MLTAPVATPEHGIIDHYSAEAGFGFLRTEGDPDEKNNLYFHISVCDVQTPAPRAGERVLFIVDIQPVPHVVALIQRVALTEQAPASIFQESKPPRGFSAQSAVVQQPEHTRKEEREGASNTSAFVHKMAKKVKSVEKALASTPSFFQGSSYQRYVYVDLDNIWVSFIRANHLVNHFPGAASTKDLFLDLEGFTRRLASTKESAPVARLVAFYYNTPEAIANRLRKISHGSVAWDVRKQETTTDTTMQLELLNAKRPCKAHPKTLVLVTGDGNIAPNGMCFREILDLYLRDGWYVEVHAWLSSMARSYIEFQRQYPSSVIIRPFEREGIKAIVRPRKQAAAKSRTEYAAPLGFEYEEKAPASGVSEWNIGAVGLEQAVNAVRVTSSTSYQVRSGLETKPASNRFSADQIAKVLQQLEGNDGNLFVPTALMMLEQTGAIGPHSGIRETDPDTQLLMVTMALQEEVDSAVRRQLVAENTAG